MLSLYFFLLEFVVLCLYIILNVYQIMDPIENRYKDEAGRAQATRNLLDCIEEYRRGVGSLSPNARDAVRVPLAYKYLDLIVHDNMPV